MGEYRDIRSIAVHTEDVVAAVETNLTGGPHTVLRVTPPFGGRMRARLHVERPDEYEDDPEPIHIDPANLVAEVPPRPTPDETEDHLRADPGTDYTIETHHERHREAVAAWRDGLVASVVESVEFDGKYGPHRVAVFALG